MFSGARLACVEPIPENLQVLACNLNLNGIQAEVISAAIDGKVWIQRCKEYYGHKISLSEVIRLPDNSKYLPLAFRRSCGV